jgi:phospholipase C
MIPNIHLQDKIKHVFVVMLENRAFDHMLGLSNIQGTDALSGLPTTIDGLNASNDWNLDLQGNKVSASSPANWSMPYDPGHEFLGVRRRIRGRAWALFLFQVKISLTHLF